MASASTAPAPAPVAPRPWHVRLMWSPLALVGMMVSALISAVLIEWVGMAIGFWDPPGADHARETLVQDITYLNADFTHSVFGVAPVELAAMAGRSVSQSVVNVAARLQLEQLYRQMKTDGAGLYRLLKLPQQTSGLGEKMGAGKFPLDAETASRGFFEYLDAGIYSIQTVVVRVVVAILSLPAYVLIGLACLLDGVVARDLRKFTAANESAFAYHRYRPWAKRSFVAGWYLYITWPGPVHPNVVFVPSALLCGLAIYNTGKWFKKYF